ncbi:MAG: DUF6377 domain-containing protein [Flavobacteriaceae bacterium]|jgi:hypothetical protein|nr:DUF6377 domain-containing protein [Flavobacteriaceae bacterium]
MKKNISYFFILFILITGCKYKTPNGDLLNDLDEAIENRQMYVLKKEIKIDSLKKLIDINSSLEEKYSIQKEIYNEYKFFNGDSAMAYAYKNKRIADLANNQKYQDETDIQLSIVFSTAGLIKESMENLKNINRHRLDPSLFREYYIANEWVNRISAEFINDALFSPEYKRLELAYKDSIRLTWSKNSTENEWYRASILFEKGRYDDAERTLQALLPRISETSRRFAIINCDLASIYKKKDNGKLYEKHLILSAIADLKCAIKENISLRELAFFLYKHNPKELERANQYIQISLEDARFYNNRQRMSQIAGKLPLIVDAYQNKSRKENRTLKYMLVAISILSLFVIFTSGYIYKQMQLIKTGRRKLYILNEELEQTNTKLYSANNTLEEHVGLFMDLCSSYINKLEQYKETVRRKILSNQIEDLHRMRDSPQFIKSELKDFFNNFDKAVLNLFPNFVENFNSLLNDKGKIQLKKGELLTTELRIFALIRLGIRDSSKIATFLHYSPQTIYNYRTKIKNEAIGSREDFEKQVMNIIS